MHIIILLAIILFFIGVYKFYSNLKKYPPGPIPIPFIRNILQLNREEPQKTIAAWSKKYGPVFTFWVGNDPNIMINDYNLLKDYVVKKGDIFVGRPENYVFHLLSEEHGIVFAQGEWWREQRRFALRTLRDMGFGKTVMEDKIHEQIDSLVENIEDIFKEQGNGSEAVFDPRQPLRTAIGNIILSVVLGLKYKKDDKTLQKLMDAFLKEMSARKSRGEDVGSFTEKQLGAVIFDLYGAGLETTAITLRWAIAFLLHNPNVQTKLQTEIDTVIGKDGKVEMHYRSAMPYMVANLNEVQRLANLLPINLPRITTTVISVLGPMSHRFVHLFHPLQDIMIAGHLIPAGTTVVPQMASVHIDADMFTDPEIFNPDRFINSTDSIKNKMEYVAPFSLGKRACLGESLARMELFMILCTLLQKFSIQPAQPGCLPSLKGDFKILYNPKPFKCLFMKR